MSLEVLKSHLNEDYELNLYALARVLIDSESGNLANFLEYMCEIHIDFKSLFYEKRTKTSKKVEESSDGLIKFGKSDHHLRIYENLSPKTIIYKFSALVNLNKIEDLTSTNVVYSFGETTHKDFLSYFDLSSNLGYLRVLSSLSKDYLH